MNFFFFNFKHYQFDNANTTKVSYTPNYFLSEISAAEPSE